MKIPKFAVVLLACCSLVSGFSQNIWQAQHSSKRYVVNAKSHLTINDTIYLSILEQGYNNIPLIVNQSEDSTVAENKAYGFKLQLNDCNGFEKCALQMYNKPFFDLSFKKVEAVQSLFFPQHPQKPYPYLVEDIIFKGNTTGITYGGTLTLPKGKKNYPLAILISGTGQHDRDYTYSGHQFFTVLADYLARNGIASLRVDDRGKDETTGDFSLATTLDFANDVHEALDYLKNKKDIDHSFLGLIGHSEGGMIASIETSRNKDVKFMVSLSGVAVSGLENLELQNRAILKEFYESEILLNKHMEMFNVMFNTVYNSKKSDSLELKLIPAVENWRKQQDSAIIESLNMHDGRDLNLIYRYARTAKTNWYRYMINYNPETFLSKIKVPVLAVNGDKDIMVPAKENLEGFRNHLPNNANLSTKVYRNLNHMYQHCVSCTNEEIPELEEVFAVEALKDISEWIKNNYN